MNKGSGVVKYYNTKDVYFGCLTYNTGKEGFFKTGAEAFIKTKEDNYLRLKAKNEIKLNEFSAGTEEYLTVSDLFPMIDMMGNKKIPDTVSESVINLYLLKHKLFGRKEIKNIDDYKQKRTR